MKPETRIVAIKTPRNIRTYAKVGQISIAVGCLNSHSFGVPGNLQGPFQIDPRLIASCLNHVIRPEIIRDLPP